MERLNQTARVRSTHRCTRVAGEGCGFKTPAVTGRLKARAAPSLPVVDYTGPRLVTQRRLVSEVPMLLVMNVGRRRSGMPK